MQEHFKFSNVGYGYRDRRLGWTNQIIPQLWVTDTSLTFFWLGRQILETFCLFPLSPATPLKWFVAASTPIDGQAGMCSLRRQSRDFFFFLRKGVYFSLQSPNGALLGSPRHWGPNYVTASWQQGTRLCMSSILASSSGRGLSAYLDAQLNLTYYDMICRPHED